MPHCFEVNLPNQCRRTKRCFLFCLLFCSDKTAEIAASRLRLHLWLIDGQFEPSNSDGPKNDSNVSSQYGSLKVWTWNLGRPAALQGRPRVNMFLKRSSRPGGAETSFQFTESWKIGVPSVLHLFSVPQLLQSSLGVFLDCLLLPQQDPFFHNGALLQAGRGRRAFTLHYFCFLLFCQSHGHPHCHRKLPGVWSGDRLVPPILAPDPVSHRGNVIFLFFYFWKVFFYFVIYFFGTVGVSHSQIYFFLLLPFLGFANFSDSALHFLQHQGLESQ